MRPSEGICIYLRGEVGEAAGTGQYVKPVGSATEKTMSCKGHHCCRRVRDTGAWIYILHSKCRNATCSEPRHDGPGAPHCSLPSSTSPGLLQAPGRLQHSSAGVWWKDGEMGRDSGKNKDFALRLVWGAGLARKTMGLCREEGRVVICFMGKRRQICFLKYAAQI